MCCLNFRRIPNHRISNLWCFFLLSKFVVILKYLHVIHQVVKCFFFSLFHSGSLKFCVNIQTLKQVYPFHQVGSYHFSVPWVLFLGIRQFSIWSFKLFSVYQPLVKPTQIHSFCLSIQFLWNPLVFIKCFPVYYGFNQNH